VAYCVLSFLAFQKVMRIYLRDNNGVDEKGTLWATLCATFIGPFTVVAFFALGTLLLLKKTLSESGLTYSYGALHWSSLWMAVVVLQSAVSLQGQKGTMEDLWEKKPSAPPTLLFCCVALHRFRIDIPSHNELHLLAMLHSADFNCRPQCQVVQDRTPANVPGTPTPNPYARQLSGLQT
jgi:hypothetical protein